MSYGIRRGFVWSVVIAIFAAGSMANAGHPFKTIKEEDLILDLKLHLEKYLQPDKDPFMDRDAVWVRAKGYAEAPAVCRVQRNDEAEAFQVRILVSAYQGPGSEKSEIFVEDKKWVKVPKDIPNTISISIPESMIGDISVMIKKNSWKSNEFSSVRKNEDNSVAEIFNEWEITVPRDEKTQLLELIEKYFSALLKEEELNLYHG